MASGTRKKTRSSPERQAVAELPSRLVYGLLKAAVKVAARAGMPMFELVDLVQLAYFEEARRRHPHDLQKVADALGMSLRNVGALNQRLKLAFFAAGLQVHPARRLAGALVQGKKTLAELGRSAPELDASQIKATVDFLKNSGWVVMKGGRYTLVERLRAYVNTDLAERIEALNDQMEVVAASAWARIVQGSDSAGGRSFFFRARPKQLLRFMSQNVKDLRHGAIELEERALKGSGSEEFGITFSFGPTDQP